MRRWMDVLLAALTAGVVIALIGGAILWADLHETAEKTAATAEKNSGLICALGSAVGDNRIEQRAEENLNEFRRRVRTTRQFVAKLNELDDCDAKEPNAVRLKRKDREKLRQDRRQRQGGDASNNAPPGNSQPAPGNGGFGGHIGGSGSGPPPKEPPPNRPPDPLDPVLDPVCDLAPDLDVDLPVCRP